MTCETRQMTRRNFIGSSTRTRERPRSNLETGLVAAEIVQKSLDAMDNERVERFV